MFSTFSHLSQAHDMSDMSSGEYTDHCMSIIFGVGMIIAILIPVIVYLLLMWSPKKVIDKKPIAKKVKKK